MKRQLQNRQILGHKKREESIEDIIKSNNKQIERNKFITAKQPEDPELSENIINSILNDNVQSAYQDKSDSKQRKKKMSYVQQQTNELNEENQISKITEQNEELEGEELEGGETWIDEIKEDIIHNSHRQLQRSISVNTNHRVKSEEKVNKKNVKIIKQSVDAQKFELNKHIINNVIYNKMNRGMNLQKKVENDILLRNKQLDSKTSDTINSFKIVNTTMRKSDFIVNYDWLYKKLIDNKKQFEKNPELDKEIQAMERDKLNYQYLNDLFVEKYQKLSQDLRQKKLQVGDLRISINNMHQEIKQLQHQQVAVKKKYEELENQQMMLRNAVMSSISRKGYSLGQPYRGNYTIDKKQSKLQEMKEVEEMAILKNIRQLQNEIDDRFFKIEDIEKKILIQKKDKSHLKYQFKVFLFKLIQTGIASYKGSICELIKLLKKLKVDIIAQDIPRFLDDESKDFIFQKAKIELDLEEVEKQKILIKEEISRDKRLQHIDFNLFLDQFKERKQLMKDKLEIIKKENVKVLRPIIKIVDGIQMQNGSQWEQVYDEQQMIEKFQERQTIKQVLNIEDIDFLDVLPKILENQQNLEQQKYEIEQQEIKRLYLIFLQKLQQSTADIETKFEKFELTFKVIFGFKQGEEIFKNFILLAQEKNIGNTTEDSSSSQRLKKANANIIQTLQHNKNISQQSSQQILSYFTTPNQTSGSGSSRKKALMPILADIEGSLTTRDFRRTKNRSSFHNSNLRLETDNIIENFTSRSSKSNQNSLSSSVRSSTQASTSPFFLNQIQIDKAKTLLQKGNNSKQQEQIMYQEVNFSYEPIYNQMPQYQNMFKQSSFFNSNSSQFQCYTPQHKQTHKRNSTSDLNFIK
ncbi:hypothetical protein TTHERM_00592870 (macronuclear) [Tetrahymena thermophila SB210]|uniref:Uncharacterized protein n=1 Tax=Tetrahymena thermophila (strain SB210) TaxID=312017 RepID=Q232L1_TETTS|nr:hypothetical protein TTHERM_00592870 [Tetrahymena thermophila SB210]EAR91401.2 hypothetical protein TTHERM_00592870 [Tetrahymena thermophila SB210]|eukprot:XP_001011646.2 hypothetical protein TTHERM_00592870 [Tetrahymena thermophila SB210]